MGTEKLKIELLISFISNFNVCLYLDRYFKNEMCDIYEI